MISILLASYNGEAYIAEQIDSLMSQSERNFKLFIQDDCSSDGTFSIARAYAAKEPGKVSARQNSVNSGGPKHNFIKMMIERKDDYLMLCDQDDVWLPDKIEISLAEMRRQEAERGAETPILVHTDLIVAGKDLRVISPSYKKAMNSNFGKTALRNCVIQNTLTGCTAMYNRALANLITEAPPFTVAHDWWLLLLASAFGRVAPLEARTVLYRQHGGNHTGAKDVRKAGFIAAALLNCKQIKKAINATYPQAESLLKLYAGRLSAEQKKFLAAYCDIPNHIKPVRQAKLIRLGTFKNGIARKAANFMFV